MVSKLDKKEVLQILEKGKEKFSPGHRTCAGCFIPTIVRTVLGNLPKDHEAVTGVATGCAEVTSTLWPHTSWNTGNIHSAFENVSTTISGAESAYQIMKKNGYNKNVKFIAFGGDGGTVDIGLAALSGTLERGHDMLYVLYDNECYANCLSLSSQVMTKEGLKRIIDVKLGEELYVFNLKTHELELKECSGIFDNGTKEVFEIDTTHHVLKATGNHPFLVVQRNGRGKKVELVWKMVEQLKNKDEVVVLKNIDFGKSHKFKEIKLIKKGDYKVNRINDFTLPKQSSLELMEYLGLYVGDGWIRQEKGEIGFALPEKTIGRERLLYLHEQIFNLAKHSKNKVYVCYQSKNIANFIDSLGFEKGAKNKTIPTWVFSLPKQERKAFVKGLMLSDGNIIDNSYRYTSASYELLEKLRLLLQTLDYRVGKIHWRKVLKGTKIVKRNLLKDTEAGYICFSKKIGLNNIKKYPSQSKYWDYLAGNKSFETETIKSIRSKGFEPTIDLRVEGEHNFIANGFVVHNTGIQRSGSTPIYANTTTSPNGEVKNGKQEYKKDIMKIVAGHNIPYLAQANPYYLDDFVYKIKKSFSIKGPKFLSVLMPCTLSWKFPTSMTAEISRLATETNIWPLYEVENGKYNLNYEPKEKLNAEEFLRVQGRFKHIFNPKNDIALENIQKNIDSNFNYLKKMTTLGKYL